MWSCRIQLHAGLVRASELLTDPAQKVGEICGANSPATTMIAAFERLDAIQNHRSLKTVYRGPQPFDRLVEDCLLIYEAISEPVVTSIAKALLKAPHHIKTAQAVYEAQLRDELVLLIESGFLGPTQSENSAVSPKSKLWGSPEKRAEKRREAEQSSRSGTPKTYPIWSPAEAIDQVVYWLPKLFEKFEAWRAVPTVRVFGTARDVIPPDIESFMQNFARVMVGLDVSVIHGLGDTGAMGIASRSWYDEIAAQSKESAVLVGGVPLFFSRKARITEERSTLTSAGAVAPRQMNFESRTLLLFALGEEVVKIFLPGGRGTDEESARGALWEQMAPNTQTVYSGGKTPAPNVFIDARVYDEKGEPDGWFRDGQILHFRRQLQRLQQDNSRTVVNRDDVKNIYFIRIGPPEKTPEGINVLYFPTPAEAAEGVLKLAMPFIGPAKTARAALVAAQAQE